MCYLVAHDKIQLAYEDDGISIGDRSIPKNSTIKVFKALGATLDFIDIWLKLFVDKYDSRYLAYITSVKDMFKQIPQTMIKPLNPK